MSLTFPKMPQKSPLPSVGGDEGEGGPNGLYFVHPHPNPPHRRGRGLVGKYQISLALEFRVSSLGFNIYLSDASPDFQIGQVGHAYLAEARMASTILS